MTISRPLLALPTFAFSILLAISAPAWSQAKGSHLPSSGDVKAAIAAEEANADLTEEERSKRIDTLRRVQGFLNNIDEFNQKKANYAAARDTARGEAQSLRSTLEKDMGAYEGKEPEPPKGADLDQVRQEIESAKTELSALESRVGSLGEKLKAQTGRPEKIRLVLTERNALKNELAGQVAVSAAGEAASPSAARQWLLVTQAAAIAAEIAMLEEELLSQPMRVELMTAQQDRAGFDVLRLRAKVKSFDDYASKLRQAEAQKVLTEVASTQERVADAHPAIQELAQANTLLTAEITARTTELEGVKAQTEAAVTSARQFESDLESIQRKLEVLGMSQALGRVLREQQLRVPTQMRTRADLAQRDEQVSKSSLRQLVYEDERNSLRSLGRYVSERLSDLPPEEAEAITEDMKSLARTRRELIASALDTETTYLRALGDLDFETRRAQTAATTYREFISERLLWIRSADPFSMQTAVDFPRELMRLLSPGHWWNVLKALPGAIIGSVLYPLLLLVVMILVRYHKRFNALLKDTGKNVGNVAVDTFSSTLQALLLTIVTALKWPLLMLTLGMALDAYLLEGVFEKSVAIALERTALYFYGFELIRCLMLPHGVMCRHFQWQQSTVNQVSRQLRLFEMVFIPAVVVATIANRAIEKEGQGVLASLALIVSMVVMALFFARMPSVLPTTLTPLINVQSNQRRMMFGRLARYLLIAVPASLVVAVVLGYIHTAIEFLLLLLLTLGLLSLLLLAHELGVRWLRILRLRLIESERQAAMQAAREARESDTGKDPDFIEVDFDEPDPDSLDQAGRYLINAVLGVVTLLGVWGIWAEVLPALGILNTVELWTTTQMVEGVETAQPVTPVDIVQVLLIGFVGVVAIKRVPSLLELFLRQRLDLAPGTVYAGVTLFRYVLIAVVTVVVLSSLGANWGSIQWAVAALSVGIGFGLQEIVANFISGLILLFEQPIRVGDTVTVGETSGVVTKIRMRATTVRDWDGRELLVPNKEFITGRLLNWSLSDQQSRIVIEIGVAYGSDVPLAMRLALEAAREHPDVLEDPEPFITFDSFGDNSLLLRLRAYLPSVDRRLSISSEIRNAINDKYNEAGVVIAFPQRDVHLNTLGPLEVNVTKSGPESA